MPIIDFHMHVTTAREYAGWFKKWLRPSLGQEPTAYLDKTLKDPEAFVDYLDQEGIDYAVCLAETNPLTTGTSPNQRVARFCAASPRLIPMANINPYVTADPESEFRGSVEDGHQGFKFYPVYQHFYPNDPQLYPIYGLLQDEGLPAMFHTGSSTFPGARLKYGDPLYLDDVAVDFPKLAIILCHAGRGFWYDRAFFLARLHPNVYLDITGLPPRNLLDYFPALETLSQKILFGSDWPAVTDIAANIAAIRGLPIREETKRAILGDNAARLLGVVEHRI